MTTYHAQSAIKFYHPWLFWLGTLAVVAGVLSHLPMFIDAAAMDYHMAGMAMDPLMWAGMLAIIIGTLMSFYGLYPVKAAQLGQVKVVAKALDEAPLTPAHWKLIAVLLLALLVDVMKPATLGFVMPGTAAEYNLSKSQVALLPLAGLTGTALGSFIWGYLGDVIGRRAAILLAAIIFIGTSICGAMPSYGWNVFMCFMMGLGAGGMLPITFALLSEIVPARQRGWLVVLVGGVGTVGGYLAASGSAALLEPHFGWRILWFLGLPTGIVLILLNRYIPESPRFLMLRGERKEAERVMQRFGVQLVDAPFEPQQAVRTPVTSGANLGRFSQLFAPPYMPLTLGLGLYGFAWGLVNFGFLLWLPTHLRELGLGVLASDRILAQSALIAFPATALVAWLYHRWSTKGSMVLFALLTAIALMGFSLIDHWQQYPLLLSSLIVALLVSSSGVIAMLSPYTAEVYPSHVRATGSGWAAGSSKIAGVVALGSALMVGAPGLVAAAWIVATPTVISAFLLGRNGVETRGKALREL